ncbi:hypothetical protein [Nocardioides sp.]|uniref:hypothetical protein n=1 Tax=Nocardioides sp. TaxID=35761 RepID=UPI002721D7A9|nr:hypothetical protein [Nocardioides sp.]MDO9455346.1 hypothetical protein [Nocardioides sp.]
MRKILRGLTVATALTLAPLSAAAVTTAPAHASGSLATSSVTATAPDATALKAKPARTITLRDLPGPQARVRITVKPKFGNKPLIIQTRKAGKFRNTGKIRTNARGVAVKVFAGSRAGIRYRLIAVGGRDYATSAVTFTVTRR